MTTNAWIESPDDYRVDLRRRKPNTWLELFSPWLFIGGFLIGLLLVGWAIDVVSSWDWVFLPKI